jgi:hypothetical protein
MKILCHLYPLLTIIVLAICWGAPLSAKTWQKTDLHVPVKYFTESGTRSITVDAGGNPHIVYGGDHLYHASFNANRWNVEIVDDTPRTGEFASISIDTSDNIHISYYNASDGDLKFAVGNFDTWRIESPDTDDDVGRHCAIALDSADTAHISYYDSSRRVLKYAYTIGKLSVSPESHDFGVQDVGPNTNGVEITLTNIGSADLEDADLSLSDTLHFSVDVNGGGNPCGTAPISLPSGAGCTVETFFKPGSKGLFNADLLFSSDDSSASVALNGIGVQGPQDLSPSPSSLDFGRVTVGGTPRALQVDFYNFGSVDLYISTMAISTQTPFTLDVNGGTKP